MKERGEASLRGLLGTLAVVIVLMVALHGCQESSCADRGGKLTSSYRNSICVSPDGKIIP